MKTLEISAQDNISTLRDAIGRTIKGKQETIELAIVALLAEGHALTNLDTGEPLSSVRPHVVSANAYLGARPIVEALKRGASVVITGRFADASLTLGPAVHTYSWAWDDWDRLAAGTVACGGDDGRSKGEVKAELTAYFDKYRAIHEDVNGRIVGLKTKYPQGYLDLADKSVADLQQTKDSYRDYAALFDEFDSRVRALDPPRRRTGTAAVAGPRSNG